MPAIRRSLALLLALSWSSTLLVAQTSTSGVIGKIFDQNTNEPIVQGIILLDSTRVEVAISTQGRFVLGNLAPGRHRIEIRVIGYRPHLREITLLDGQVLEQQFPLVFTGERLPEVSVEARNSKLLPRFSDFERRRQRGLGSYISRDEIRAQGYMSMGDALRTVKGVRVNCGPIDCAIHMTRSTAGCFPVFYVDGRLARSFAATTPISDVQGIEVYRGAAEMPGEFAGAGAMCGVIVIWTRAAP